MAILRRKNDSSYLTVAEITALFGGKVIKRYKDKIVLAKPPSKPKRKKKPTQAQKDRRKLMLYAVYFARKVIKNPVRMAAWKKFVKGKGYSSVNQAIISWYLKNEGKTRKLRGVDPNLDD
jgi:hypothetical protein